ncbi:MAG: indole-3-glycerol phosphate synthase TrpC [Bacteroidia bacterium]|nr:indole-3-glycerol phosphate synthase TrpC [Bacteroidia bacterium]
MTILDKIVANKRVELESYKQALPLEVLKMVPNFSRECLSMKQALVNSDTGIIAEFKRRSPSRGFIHEGADVQLIVGGYEKNGASAISILADKDFFAGGPMDMQLARNTVTNTPLLFKEFVTDEYQLYLAKASGADAVLLIASVLEQAVCNRFASLAKDLGLEVLLELHTQEEIAYVQPNVDMVGINNRNLKTFEVDLNESIKLCSLVPESYVKIAESGLNSPETVKLLRQKGFSGFLMGEYFMKKQDPAEALNRFIKSLKL